MLPSSCLKITSGGNFHSRVPPGQQMAMFLSFTPRLMGQRPWVMQGVFIRWLLNQLKICKRTADHPLFIYFYLELMNSVKFHNGKMITVCLCWGQDQRRTWISEFVMVEQFDFISVSCFLKWDSFCAAFWQPGFSRCGTKGHLTAAGSFLFHFFRGGLLPQHQPRWPWLLAWSQNLCGAGSDAEQGCWGEDGKGGRSGGSSWVAPSAAQENWRWTPPALPSTADIALRARLCLKRDRSVLSKVREICRVNWS